MPRKEKKTFLIVAATYISLNYSDFGFTKWFFQKLH